MLERTDRKSISFELPFFVEGLDREQPAGTYTVETVQELIEGLSFLAYRTVSTSVLLPLPGSGAGSYQLARINPLIVHAAGRRNQDEAPIGSPG